jgi:hypothetical protein
MGQVAIAAKSKPTKKPVKPKTKATLTATQVLDKSIEATGGQANYDKIKTMVMTGTMELAGMGLKLEMQIFNKMPDKFLVIQKMPQIGEFKQGFDGKVGWSSDPLNGLRELTGNELVMLKRQSSINSDLKWRETYKKVEMVGVKKLETGNAYQIRITPITGKPMSQYYDTKTFLPVRADMVVESPQGTIPVEIYLLAWKTVDGIKVPVKMKAKMSMADMVANLTDIKTNVSIDDAIFAKPTTESTPEPGAPSSDRPSDEESADEPM